MFWRRSFFSGFALITLLTVGIGIYIYGIPDQQMRQGQWVLHTHEVMTQLEALSGDMVEVRAVRTEYMQTHMIADYTNYEVIVKRILQTLTEIETLTKDNPEQQARVSPLRESVVNHLARFAQDMKPELAVSPGLPADAIRVASDAIAQRIEAMHQEEESLLQVRLMEWHKAVSHTRLLFLGGITILYLLILVTFVVAIREARIREQLLEIETETATMQRGMAARMTQVVDIQHAIISQRLNLQNAMQIITKQTQIITRAEGAVIEMLEGDEMVYRSASGSMANFVGFKLKAKGSLSGLCIESAEPLSCDDSETDSRVDKDACRKVGVRAMIVVPLIQQREVVGVLKVASGQPKAFSSEDVATLQLMAGLLSATLRDAVAAEALQDSNQSLNMNNMLLKTQKAKLESDRTELKTRADTDGMTGLKNHRYFQEQLLEEYERAKRYNTPLSLMLIDVDRFKEFNDSHGHPAGDEVLRQMGKLLMNCARPSDCVARYGGEEFAVLLTHTDMEGAFVAAERIRQSVMAATWKHQPITVSIGVSGLGFMDVNAASLVDQADKALYQSKTNGRDRTTRFTANIA